MINVEEYKILNDDISVIELQIKELSSKKREIDNRIEEIRKAMLDDMLTNGVMSEEDSGLLFVVKSVPANPIIADENKIPEKYWKIKREIDKKLINEDYKNGIDIDGVTLSNGGQTLMIKAKQ